MNITIEKMKYNNDNLEELITIIIKAFGINEINKLVGMQVYIESIKDCRAKYFKFVLVNGKRVGCYEYTPSGMFQNFCVIPEFQRKGIGTAVIENLLGEKNIDSINIVNKPSCMDFYTSFPHGTFHYRDDEDFLRYI